MKKITVNYFYTVTDKCAILLVCFAFLRYFNLKIYPCGFDIITLKMLSFNMTSM